MPALDLRGGGTLDGGEWSFDPVALALTDGRAEATEIRFHPLPLAPDHIDAPIVEKHAEVAPV